MNITSANATLVLSCADFALASVSVEGFAVDDAWSFEETEHVVAQKGVDGKMSAGWVPVLNNMRINFSPDSPFNAQMMALLQAQKAARKPFLAFCRFLLWTRFSLCRKEYVLGQKQRLTVPECLVHRLIPSRLMMFLRR